MLFEKNLKLFICAYLEKIGINYCDWDISKILPYVIMDDKDFIHSNPQFQTVLDSIDKIYEQDMWNLSLKIRNIIYHIKQ